MQTLAAQALPAPIARAQMISSEWHHGASPFGDLKYPSGFKQFDYVNAKAPKGGAARQIALGTYDNFNMVVDGIKGTLALGLDLNCPPSALVGQIRQIEEGSVSGSS
jgi:microcin C transport system substrate-binding protein